MARTEGIYVEGNNVTEIPDGGSVRVEVFSSTQNHVTDTPLYTWPVSVQDGRFLIDIPQATTNQYPDKAQFSIVATMATGEKVRKLIAGPKGGTQLQRKGAIFAPAFITPNNTVFTGPELAFEWEGPPGAHYDLHVYTDAARTIKATDVDGNALDTVGIGMATSHTFAGVPENGATLYPRLFVWDDSAYSGTPAQVDITVTASSGTPSFADFDTTLDGSTHTFTILNGKAGWRYDLVFNGSDTTASVLWPVNTITRSDLPVDGGRYPVRLAMWPDGDTSQIDYIDGFVTAYQQYSSAPAGSKIIIPGTDVAEGSYDVNDWTTAIDGLDSTFWEAGGTPVTSVTEFKGARSICVRLDATSSPSTRMAAGADLDPSQELTIEQDIVFSDDFVWGGSNKGGKVGFGCGGGTRKSGGNAGPSDPDTQGGFTARLMWRATTEENGQMYAYLYHAGTVGYGTDVPTGFYPKRGERFRTKTRVGMNSSAGVADGTYELWINDIKRIELDDIEWFGTGTPQVDTLLTYNFHGGNDSTWSPPSGHVNRLYLSSIYYADENYVSELPPSQLAMISPASGYEASTASVFFEWSDPARPGAVYDLHVYSDAARTQLVTGTDGSAFDAVGIGPGTSYTFDHDPGDGGRRYCTLFQWEDDTYNPDYMTELKFEYTAYTAATSSTARGWGAMFGSLVMSNRTVSPMDSTTSSQAEDKVAVGFLARGTRIDAVRLYHIYRVGTSSNYSRGDGGTVKYTIQTADSAGRPSGTVLAETDEFIAAPELHSSQSAASATYPGAVWSFNGESGTQLNKFRLVDLQSSVTTTVGQKYFVVVEQVRGGGTNWISINSTRNRPGSTFHFDPSFDVDDDWVVYTQDGGTWTNQSEGSKSTGYMPVFEINGDEVYGNSYFEAANEAILGVDSSRYAFVDSGQSLRYVWTPPQSMSISDVVLSGAYRSGANSVTVSLKQGGSTLGTVSVTGFPTASSNDLSTILSVMRPKKAAFGSPVSVASGAPLYIELSTSGNVKIGSARGCTSYFTQPPDDGNQFGFSGSVEVDTGSGWTASQTDFRLAVLLLESA